MNKAIHQYRIIEKHISLCRSRAEKSFYFLTKGFKSIHAEHLFRLSMFANTNAKSHAKVFHNQNTILASRTYHGELWSSVTTDTWYQMRESCCSCDWLCDIQSDKRTVRLPNNPENVAKECLVCRPRFNRMLIQLRLWQPCVQRKQNVKQSTINNTLSTAFKATKSKLTGFLACRPKRRLHKQQQQHRDFITVCSPSSPQESWTIPDVQGQTFVHFLLI